MAGSRRNDLRRNSLIDVGGGGDVCVCVCEAGQHSFGRAACMARRLWGPCARACGSGRPAGAVPCLARAHVAMMGVCDVV